MALNCAPAPAAVMNTSPSRYHNSTFHHQQPSPLSSASSTPDTISPTSPRGDSVSPPTGYNHFPRRQIRAPKTPMYTPAVLRPTESPAYWRALEQRRSNLAAGIAASKSTSINQITPPSSASNSFDDIDGKQCEVARQTLAEQLAEGKITRIVTEEWSEGRPEDVLGSPTKSHWKPDAHSLQCEFGDCGIAFSLVTRRHHCRRCGKIFCAQHSTHVVPLNQNAAFHFKGEAGRACDDCWHDYKHWARVQKNRRNNSYSGFGSGSESGSGTATPVNTDKQKQDDAATDDSASDSAASSAPKTSFGSFCNRDWNWSTF